MLGSGHPVLIAAEVGINHNGDMTLAKEMIHAASEAGADAVKFQNYRTDDFLPNQHLTYEYVSQGKRIVESQYTMFKRCELTPDQIFDLREFCDRTGVIFFSTPTSEEGVSDLIDCGCQLIKNGSDYLTHLPLIRAMAKSSLVTVLSTGMATEDEIIDAVNTFRRAGGRDLILLHCTSSYPTPDEDVNLRRIPALSDRFAVQAGFSDHTWGNFAAVASVGLGACFVEKHFTLDKELPGPDHRFSSDPMEFRDLVEGIRRMEVQLGDRVFRPTASEARGRVDYRLSCTLRVSRPANHMLTEGDIAFQRPGNGIAPKYCGDLVGKRLRRDLPAGKTLIYDDLL